MGIGVNGKTAGVAYFMHMLIFKKNNRRVCFRDLQQLASNANPTDATTLSKQRKRPQRSSANKQCRQQ